MRVDSELSLATILGKSKRICCYRTCPITNAVVDDNSARRAPPLIQYLVFTTPPHLALPCTQTLRSSEYIGDEGIIGKVSKMLLSMLLMICHFSCWSLFLSSLCQTGVWSGFTSFQHKLVKTSNLIYKVLVILAKFLHKKTCLSSL